MKNLFFPIGGGNEIGASCYYFNIDGEKILLDSGLRLHSDLVYPQFELLYSNNIIDGLWELSGIFISHGHIDHIGSLPKIINEANNIQVYTAIGTKEIINLQIQDTLRISSFNIDYSDYNLRLFNQLMLEKTINSIIEKDWGSSIDLNNAKVTFYPAGHILGASLTYIETEKYNILYTGDFSNFDQFTVSSYRIPSELKVDILITETTYGYQNHYNKEEIETERINFGKQLEYVIGTGGKVLIPAFAIGRSQEIALTLSNLIDNDIVSKIPIYIDGMAKSASDIYELYGIKIFNHNVRKAPFKFINQLDSFNGIIISSSGMLIDNSLSAKYAEIILPDSKSAIFFTGYLDEESPGNKLYSIKNNYRKFCRINGKNIPVNAHINLYRLSAHSNSEGILDLIERLMPKKVIFVHGYPQYGTEVNILSDSFKKFGKSIEFYQANNSIPIYF